jgi:hypothetical protein
MPLGLTNVDVPKELLSGESLAQLAFYNFARVFFSFGLSICFDNELSGSVCR